MSHENLAVPIPRPVRTAGAVSFGVLFTLESFVRSINSTVLPLQTLALFGSGQRVSMVSTLVSASVLVTCLFLPLIMARLARRWTYTFGAMAFIAASLLFASFTEPALALGLYLRGLATSITGIVLSLYILDYFRRSDLTRVEPLRLSMSTLAWSIGPASGIILYDYYGPAAPQIAAILATCVLLGWFWFLRLSTHHIVRPGPVGQPSPLANIHKFARQPRLRLAGLIAFSRRCFWIILFIYSPIMLVQAGLGAQAAGWLISASQMLLVFSWGAGWLARKVGVRMVLAGGFALCACGSIAAGLVGGHMPWLASGLLLLASLGCVALDAVGGVPFLRAVRNRERAEMTAVYRIFVDLAEFIPAGVFSVALLFFPVSSVFVILGLWLSIVAWIVWRFLPASM